MTALRHSCALSLSLIRPRTRVQYSTARHVGFMRRSRPSHTLTRPLSSKKRRKAAPPPPEEEVLDLQELLQASPQLCEFVGVTPDVLLNRAQGQCSRACCMRCGHKHPNTQTHTYHLYSRPLISLLCWCPSDFLPVCLRPPAPAAGPRQQQRQRQVGVGGCLGWLCVRARVPHGSPPLNPHPSLPSRLRPSDLSPAASSTATRSCRAYSSNPG